MSGKLRLALIEGLFAAPVAFDSILDEIPTGALFLDSNHRILSINRTLSALTGYDISEAKGLSCFNIIRCSRCLQQCRQMPDEDNVYATEPVNIVNRQKQKIPVKISLTPILDTQGKTTGFIEIVEDLRVQQKVTSDGVYNGRPGNLVGTSLQMEKIFNILPMVAQADSSILITGESGTGKDVIAEAIHLSSGRAKGPFIKVNCAALPETLLDSELFGHQKGAFPGASENKAGRIRLANNGTLFLSEVGNLPMRLQGKLLAFLDDKVVYSMGNTRGIGVNVRIIAASLYPLDQMVMEGRFRSDLLYRLNVVRLDLPPLREREGDIRLLLEHSLRSVASQFNKDIRGLSDEALESLLDYHFQGNVRELKNIVEYAVSVCQSQIIQENDLPNYLIESGGSKNKTPVGFSMPARSLHNTTADSSDCTWMEMEKKMILEALVSAKGKRSNAADILGWGRSTLWRKMKKYGLE